MLLYVQTVMSAKRGEDKGASAVEYGLLVAAIAALIVVVVFALGGVIKTSFKDTCDKIAAGDASASTVACSN